MRIVIPKEIRDDLEQLEQVIIEMDDSSSPGKIILYSLPFIHIAQHDFANLIDAQWQNCTYVKYIAKYKDGREQVFDFESKDSAVYKPLDDLGVFLQGKDIRAGNFYETCQAADSIAKNNLFSFESIKNIPAYVISLNINLPRYLGVKKMLSVLGFSNISRWPAVDTRETFQENSLRYYGVRAASSFNSKGAIGCSLSHLSLYENFLASSDQYRLVFEDDVAPHSKFYELIDSVQNLSLDSFDVLFLGGWFWALGEKDAVKDLQKALDLSKQTNFLRNPVSFETHAMLISRRFAYKAVDNYRRKQETGSLLIDNYITQSKYFDTCLLTFSPFDSANVDKLQLRNMNNCGLFFQTNIYGSHIQKKDIQGIKEVKREESGGVWQQVLPAEEYDFNKFNVCGESDLLRSVVMPEIGVLMLDGGIVSPCGVVGTKEERWVLDLSWFGPAEGRARDVWQTMFKQKKNKYFYTNNLKRKPGSALNLYAVWRQFNPGHFQMDSLGMLALFIESSLKDLNTFDWICLPSTQTRIKKDLLDFLDLDPFKIIEISPEESYQFDELYAPSLYGSPMRYRRNAFNYIRKLFKASAKNTSGRLLYVSREESGRDASNIGELEELLHDYGFQKVYTKKLKNYVGLFSEASIILGAHGAGLANCMFSSADATLIELVPDFHQKPYYMSLADSLSMDYVGVLCADAGIEIPTESHTVNKEKRFAVNLNLLEGVINATLHKKL